MRSMRPWLIGVVISRAFFYLLLHKHFINKKKGADVVLASLVDAPRDTYGRCVVCAYGYTRMTHV